MKLLTNLPKHNKIYKDVLYSYNHDYDYNWLMHYNKQCGEICLLVLAKMQQRKHANNWKIGIWHWKDWSPKTNNGAVDYHAYLYQMNAGVIYDVGADLTIPGNGNILCMQQQVNVEDFCFDGDNPNDYCIEYFSFQEAAKILNKETV
jgi:hypothetical protein